jgi:hypothetical protein
MGFTKLFSSLVTSSIWCEKDTTLRVWIAMLATCDSRGIVEGSIPGFASLARVSVEDMEEAERILSSPDEHSRTKANDGRRIAACDGGWKILNYLNYREKGQDKDGSRAPYFRERRSGAVARNKGVLRDTQGTVARYTEERRESTDAEVHTPQTPQEGPAGVSGAVPDSFHVELPPRFPASALEAVAQSMTAGCPPDFVQKTWDMASSRGGHDAKDVPIRNWASYMMLCWKYEKEREAKAKTAGGNGRPPSIMDLKTAIGVKEERLKELRFNYAHEQPGGGWKWKDDAKLVEAKALKAEIAGLKAQIEAKAA